jgi:HlyD family secretion protein
MVTLPGRITWIASAAEFTPTPIQTREERADQVYAVKVAVANPEGRLRIGMPGELVLAPGGADE